MEAIDGHFDSPKTTKIEERNDEEKQLTMHHIIGSCAVGDNV
jgi:hypothetical protein